MREQSWTYMDRSGWTKGEWDDEPDKVQFTDQATGLPCLVVRNQSGALCGYVGVTEGHPAFGIHYDQVEPYPDVHGGLTFADFCRPYGKNHERGVCHIPDEGEPARVWWLGFDCAHCDDVIPAFSERLGGFGEQYRSLSYVRHQCTALASQLAVTNPLPLGG